MRKARFLPLSGKSEQSLQDLAGLYLNWLNEHAGELSRADASCPLFSDMAWTAGVGRSHFNHRAGLVFRDLGSLQEGLKALAGTGKGHGPETRSKVAFVYTGQASQWVGMGKALYENEPVVRAVLDCCDDVLRGARGASLLDVMFGRSGSDPGTGRPGMETARDICAGVCAEPHCGPVQVSVRM